MAVVRTARHAVRDEEHDLGHALPHGSDLVIDVRDEVVYPGHEGYYDQNLDDEFRWPDEVAGGRRSR